MEVLFDIFASKMYAATSLGTLFLTFLLFFVVPALVLIAATCPIPRGVASVT
jgi:hypothetical protein